MLNYEKNKIYEIYRGSDLRIFCVGIKFYREDSLARTFVFVWVNEKKIEYKAKWENMQWTSMNQMNNMKDLKITYLTR